VGVIADSKNKPVGKYFNKYSSMPCS
jgi:hypothetical protein